MVAQGHVDAGSQDQVVNAIADVVGIGIIFITSLFSLVQVLRDRMSHVKTTPTQTTVTVETKPATEVFTETPVIEVVDQPGTPPVENAQ